MASDASPAALRFWAIAELRLALFHIADQSTLTSLIRTSREVFEQVVPILWREMASRHALAATACPDPRRQASYRSAIRTVLFEHRSWLTKPLADHLQRDHTDRHLEADMVISGCWPEQSTSHAQAEEHDDIPVELDDDSSHSGGAGDGFMMPASPDTSSINTFEFPEDYRLNSRRLAQHLRAFFPYLIRVDLTASTVRAPRGAREAFDNCWIGLDGAVTCVRLHQVDQLECCTDTDILAHVDDTDPPVGMMYYSHRLGLGASGASEAEKIALYDSGGLTHRPRVGLYQYIDPYQLSRAADDALVQEYGRMAPIIQFTQSDQVTLLDYVDRLYIVSTKRRPLSVNEMELLIAHYTGRAFPSNRGAQTANTTASSKGLLQHDLSFLYLHCNVLPPLQLHCLLHNPLLKHLETLELHTFLSGEIGDYNSVTLQDWMMTIAEHLPSLRVVRLDSVIAPDDLCTPLDATHYPVQPSLQDVIINLEGEVTRAGDVNRAYYVSRWMKADPVVHIGLNKRKLDYTRTLARLQHWATQTSTKLDGVDLRTLGMTSRGNVRALSRSVA